MDQFPEQTTVGAKNIDISKTPYYHEMTLKVESTEPQIIGTKIQPHNVHPNADTQIMHPHIENSQPNFEMGKSIDLKPPSNVILIDSKTNTTIHTTKTDHMPTYLDTVGLEMEDTNNKVVKNFLYCLKYF